MRGASFACLLASRLQCSHVLCASHDGSRVDWRERFIMLECFSQSGNFDFLRIFGGRLEEGQKTGARARKKKKATRLCFYGLVLEKSRGNRHFLLLSFFLLFPWNGATFDVCDTLFGQGVILSIFLENHTMGRSVTSRDAAMGFLQVLVLKTLDVVQCSQEVPYGAIVIHKAAGWSKYKAD